MESRALRLVTAVALAVIVVSTACSSHDATPAIDAGEPSPEASAPTSDASPSDASFEAANSASCPALVPIPGFACVVPGLVCTYACGMVATCDAGTWTLAQPDSGCPDD